MPKMFHKHKILLDEQMPHRNQFAQLNEFFDVKHVADDLGQSGISDMQVYRLAVKQGRTIVTRNIKHFRPLAGTLNDAGIIGISTSSWDKIDKQITALLKKAGPKTLAGRYTQLLYRNRGI